MQEKTPDFDYDIVDPDAADQSASLYPVAQWHNGKQGLKSAGGVRYGGGVILPTKYLPDGLVPDGWKIEEIIFDSGNEEAVAATQKIVVAPIRSRFHWFVRQGEETVYYPRNAYAAEANMRGHLQVLSAIRGIDEPIVITFKGKASQTFEALLKDFDMKVTWIANRTAPKGKRLPRYAFWMTINPGAHLKVGTGAQKSIVTLPTLVLPDNITREYLLSCYVGRDNLVRSQEWYRQADTWASAWEVEASNKEDMYSHKEDM